ncbi:MAG: hypothetical protein AB2L14_33800 [Candidatus Xenobiia bacterium LiM19]
MQFISEIVWRGRSWKHSGTCMLILAACLCFTTAMARPGNADVFSSSEYQCSFSWPDDYYRDSSAENKGTLLSLLTNRGEAPLKGFFIVISESLGRDALYSALLATKFHEQFNKKQEIIDTVAECAGHKARKFIFQTADNRIIGLYVLNANKRTYYLIGINNRPDPVTFSSAFDLFAGRFRTQAGQFVPVEAASPPAKTPASTPEPAASPGAYPSPKVPFGNDF